MSRLTYSWRQRRALPHARLVKHQRHSPAATADDAAARRRRRAGRGGDLAQTRAARNRRLGHGCHCCGRNNDSAGWGARGRLSDLPNGLIVKLQQWLSWDIAAAAQARAVHDRLLQHGVHTYVHKDDLICMTDAWTEPVQQRHSSPEFSISPTRFASMQDATRAAS